MGFGKGGEAQQVLLGNITHLLFNLTETPPLQGLSSLRGEIQPRLVHKQKLMEFILL